jgi:hypothetical protein
MNYSDSEPKELILEIRSANANASEIEQLKYSLASEIREVSGIVSVTDLWKESSFSGAKGDAVTIGALALAILPLVIPKLVELLQTWVNRGQGRSVKIKVQANQRSVEIEFSPKDISSSDIKRLVADLSTVLTTSKK